MKKLLIVVLLGTAALLGTGNEDIRAWLGGMAADGLTETEVAAPVPEGGSGTSRGKADAKKKRRKDTASERRRMRLEIPAFLTDRPEEVIWHTAYTVSFNRKHKLPNWVAWELTKERTQGKESRSDNFQPDPDVTKGATAMDSDYRGSGFDRGHMCPAADNKMSAQAMTECFYFSNICPQLHSLNGGDWKELEEKSRKWARRYERIYIVCGPLIRDGKHRTIGESRVTVPDGFFKVFLRLTDAGGAKAIGFIYPHEKTDRPMREYAVSVDEVERQTGIDFFSKLPKEIEKKAEAECNFDDWK